MRTAAPRWLTAGVLGVGLMLACGRSGMAGEQWPKVRSLRATFEFADGAHADVLLDLFSTENKAVYRLECHGWEYSETTSGPFDYSGDFECRLTSLYSHDPQSTLLTDKADQAADWESRGRFLAEEVVGKCGTYPEYGRARHFSLRGMKLTLELIDPQVVTPIPARDGPKRPDVLRTFKFGVSVAQDPAANGTRAAAPRVSAPKRGSDTRLDCANPAVTKK